MQFLGALKSLNVILVLMELNDILVKNNNVAINKRFQSSYCCVYNFVLVLFCIRGQWPFQDSCKYTYNSPNMPETNLLICFQFFFSSHECEIHLWYFPFLDFCQETKETTCICMWGLGVNIVPRMKTVLAKLTVTIICILTVSLTV